MFKHYICSLEGAGSLTGNINDVDVLMGGEGGRPQVKHIYVIHLNMTVERSLQLFYNS